MITVSFDPDHLQTFKVEISRHHAPFQPAAAVAVNNRDRRMICDGDVVWLDADQLAILLVSVVDRLEASAPSALVQQPEIRECGGKWSRNVTDGMRADIW